MQRFNPKDLDSVFVPATCPTFGDLLQKLLTDDQLTSTRARDMASGLRRVAKALARLPEDIFCDARWLQPRLSKVQPAARGLTTKSWQNAVSDARAAMARYGVVKLKTNRIEDLSSLWQDLWQQAAASKDQSILSALRRFVYFLDRLGIAPTDVSNDHADAYRSCVEDQEISRSPDVAYRAAVNGWNLARKRFAVWPDIELTLPDRTKTVQLPMGILPDSFYCEVEAYLAKLSADDPFADDGPTRALRPATIRQYRRLLLRFAAEMVNSGVVPGSMQGLMNLLDPNLVERTLRRKLEDNGQKTSESISATARLLGRTARAISAPEEWQGKLAKMAKRVAVPHQDGMTPKNRERLRPLQNDATLLRLIDLPEQLFFRKTGRKKLHRDALAREDAIAIAILLHCPLRAKNLSEIRLDLNLQRPGDGSAYLVFESEEVKNRRPIEYEIPPEVLKLIDDHLKTRVPFLCPAGTPWLFPKRDGLEAIDPSDLASRISKRILKETGLKVNAHLFRHLAVMIYLEANQGAYEAAGRLISHSNTSRTIRVYSGMETRSATRAFSELVTAKKKRK